MRGTLHLVASEDVRWLLTLLGPLIDARDERRRMQFGLDAAVCEQGLALLRKALAGGPLTRHELRDRLRARGPRLAATGQATIHLLAHAAHRGLICNGPPQGRSDTFVLLDDWAPHAAEPRGDEALTELARRYLAAYGPATVEDFGTWSGLSMGAARAGMTAIASELTELTAGSVALQSLRGAASAGKAASGRPDEEVRLLPGWDTYTLGYRSRDWMLAGEHAHRFQREGVLSPTICVDGRLVGVWRIDNARREVAIEIEPFDSPTSALSVGVDEEVSAIGRFRGRPVRWSFAGLVG